MEGVEDIAVAKHYRHFFNLSLGRVEGNLQKRMG